MQRRINTAAAFASKGRINRTRMTRMRRIITDKTEKISVDPRPSASSAFY